MSLTERMSLGRQFWSTDHSLTALLLFLCLNLFVVLPLGHLHVAGRLLISLIFSLILISGVGAVAHNLATTVLVGVVVLASLAVHWLRLSMGTQSLIYWDTSLAALFCIMLALVVLAQVFRAGPITSHRIQGAIAVYLLVGLAFAFGYTLIDLRWPHAFAPPSLAAPDPNEAGAPRFLYFSLTTLTTVGFGDISAVHPLARSLVTLEALIGQLFPAILLARLVSMELFYRRAAHTELR